MDRKWWTLVAVCTGVFMLLLDVTIVNVALPDIQKSLGANLSQLQWVVDAYALSLAALLLTAGSIADRFGRRAMFAVGIVVFTAGSLLCGVAGDPTFLAWRAPSRASAGRSCSPRRWRCSRRRSRVASAAPRSASSAPSPVSPSPSARCSAARSPAACHGAGSSSSTSRSASSRWPRRCCSVEESHDPRARRVDYVGFVTFSPASRRSCTG